MAADWHPRIVVEEPERGVGDGSTDVVEIDVHAFRAHLAQHGVVVLHAPVIECGVVSVVAYHVVDLCIGTCDPDDAAALHLRELPDHGAHRTGAARDEHDLSSFGPAYLEQSEIGSESRHPQHTECGGDR